MTPELTVVVPTFNRARILQRCLEHLVAQTLPPDRFEVVVVDDASSDATPEVLAGWQQSGRLPLRHVRVAKSFAGGARNRGVELTAADRVVFLGDDVLAEPGLLRAHVEGAARLGPRAVLVGEVSYDRSARYTPFMAFQEADGVHHDFRTLRELRNQTLPGRYFYACNASVPTAAFRAVGGFDPSLERAWEDTELGVRLARAGWPMYFLPSARGRHLHPIDLAGYLRFLRGGRPDIARALTLLERAGEPVPTLRQRPVSDRLVTDGAVDVVARVADAALVPSVVRHALYRRVLRYERRAAFRSRPGSGAAR